MSCGGSMLLDLYLEESTARHPHKTALICGAHRATYAEVNGGANALAHTFKAMGMQRQDRVCIYYENSVATVQRLFAALKACGIFLVVNPQVKGGKLAYILNDCQAHILVLGRRNLQAIEQDLLACQDVQHIVLVDLDPDADTGAG